MDKKTVVIGASANPERYSYKAAVKLKVNGHTVFPLGIKDRNIEGSAILTGKPNLAEIDTVTMYVGPQNQTEWLEYIYSLKPKRIIFNPGTENSKFLHEAEQKGIECIEACTLVMLGIGNY